MLNTMPLSLIAEAFPLIKRGRGEGLSQATVVKLQREELSKRTTLWDGQITQANTGTDTHTATHMYTEMCTHYTENAQQR